MALAIEDQITLGSAQGALSLFGVNALTANQVEADEAKNNRESHSAQKKSRLMPTGGTAKLHSKENPASTAAEVKRAIDQMTPDQRAAFVKALKQFRSDVEEVKEVIAKISQKKVPTAPDMKALIQSAKSVREDVQAALKTAKAAGADDHSSTSIWFILEGFMVNDIMGMNNLEMSSAMKQVQAQSNALANVSKGLSDLNVTISTAQNTTDTGKSIGFSIGVFLLGLLLAPLTAGLSLLAGIAVAIALPSVNAADNASGSKNAQFGFLTDKGTPNTSDMLQDQNSQQEWSLVGTNTNQLLSTVMQLHVQQTSQVNVQVAQQFSTMINYASQTMSTGR